MNDEKVTDELNILTTYISAWGWHIIGMIFLASSIILLAMGKYVYIVITFVMTALCEIMAYKRKFMVQNGQD